MAVEDAIKQTLQDVLDVKPEEIQPDKSLEEAFGVDSTEMVEINVSLKKTLEIDMQNNDLKKEHSFNKMVEILKEKGAS